MSDQWECIKVGNKFISHHYGITIEITEIIINNLSKVRISVDGETTYNGYPISIKVKDIISDFELIN